MASKKIEAKSGNRRDPIVRQIANNLQQLSRAIAAPSRMQMNQLAPILPNQYPEATVKTFFAVPLLNLMRTESKQL